MVGEGDTGLPHATACAAEGPAVAAEGTIVPPERAGEATDGPQAATRTPEMATMAAMRRHEDASGCATGASMERVRDER